MRTWHRYIAIGDSFSEGLNDPDPHRPGQFRGWADRLASHLAADAAAQGTQTEYANVAIRGRLLNDVVTRQLDAAIALEPDLVSIVGGGNDMLRPAADVDALAEALEGAVATLRATGCDVLMATPTDPRGAPLLRHTRGRVGVFIAHQQAIARRHGAFVLDLWSLKALQDWQMWAEDRIHLTAEGHRRVALAAYAALHNLSPDGDWSTPLPPPPSATRRERLEADLGWAKEYLGPWAGRRVRGQSSGDALPPKRPVPQPADPEPAAIASPGIGRTP